MRDDSRSTSVPGRKTTMYRPSITAPRLTLGACVGVGRGATGDGTSLQATASATDARPTSTSFFMMRLTWGRGRNRDQKFISAQDQAGFR
jgi:hypothetical protein